MNKSTFNALLSLVLVVVISFCGFGIYNTVKKIDSVDITTNQGEPGEDGITPHIGENGNWWIGDIDTDIPAQGQDGQAGVDGVTPHIGENGNWWIGEIDTGIKVQGAPGTDGLDGITYEWLTGITAPASDLGKQGDMYLDIITQDVYKKTSGTVWTFQCNIKGAPGTGGVTGGEQSFVPLLQEDAPTSNYPGPSLYLTIPQITDREDLANKLFYMKVGPYLNSRRHVYLNGFVSFDLYYMDKLGNEWPMSDDFDLYNLFYVSLRFNPVTARATIETSVIFNWQQWEQLSFLLDDEMRFHQLRQLLDRYDDIMMLLDMYP